MLDWIMDFTQGRKRLLPQFFQGNFGNIIKKINLCSDKYKRLSNKHNYSLKIIIFDFAAEKVLQARGYVDMIQNLVVETCFC